MTIKRCLNPTKFPVGTVFLLTDMVTTRTIAAYSADGKLVKMVEEREWAYANDALSYAGILGSPAAGSTPAVNSPSDILTVKISPALGGLFSNNKIPAIKAYRELVGSGLADAKAYIEGEQHEITRHTHDALVKPLKALGFDIVVLLTERSEA